MPSRMRATTDAVCAVCAKEIKRGELITHTRSRGVQTVAHATCQPFEPVFPVRVFREGIYNPKPHKKVRNSKF